MAKVTRSAVYISDSGSYFKVIILIISKYVSTNILRSKSFCLVKEKLVYPSGTSCILGQPFIPRGLKVFLNASGLT